MSSLRSLLSENHQAEGRLLSGLRQDTATRTMENAREQGTPALVHVGDAGGSVARRAFSDELPVGSTPGQYPSIPARFLSGKGKGSRDSCLPRG